MWGAHGLVGKEFVSVEQRLAFFPDSQILQLRHEDLYEPPVMYDAVLPIVLAI